MSVQYPIRTSTPQLNTNAFNLDIIL